MCNCFFVSVFFWRQVFTFQWVSCVSLLIASAHRKVDQDARVWCFCFKIVVLVVVVAIVSSDRYQQQKLFMLFGVTVILMSHNSFSVDVWTKLVCLFWPQVLTFHWVSCVSLLTASTVVLGALFEVPMSTNCTPLWRKAHVEMKIHKTWGVWSTFWSSDVEKLHAVVAKSTFGSENVQNMWGSEHFLRFWCRKISQCSKLVS